MSYQKNSGRYYVLCRESGDLDTLQFFESSEAKYFRRVNRHRISHIWTATCIKTRASVNTQPGLINLGNTCCLNSVVQRLACVVPVVNYFTGMVYREDMNPLSIYGGRIARELGKAFVLMKTGNVDPVTL